MPLTRLSRSGLELFLDCPRCFYLAKKQGIKRIDGFVPALNLAVDQLFKREFDAHRLAQEVPPLLQQSHIDAVPLKHPDLARWREGSQGIAYHHPHSDITLYGAIDDVWIRRDSEKLMIVDYKAVTYVPEMDVHPAYIRQLAVYQWLFARNGFSVDRQAFVLYANPDRDRAALDGCLHFTQHLEPVYPDTGWIENALEEVAICLQREAAPLASKDCVWCKYSEQRRAE